MRALKLVAVVVVVASGCSNEMLGLDICGKLCDVSDDCGPGYECQAGVCAGGDCGSVVTPGGGDAGTVSSTSTSMVVSSGTSSATSLGSSSAPVSSSAMSGMSSSASGASSTSASMMVSSSASLMSSSAATSSSMMGSSSSAVVSSSSSLAMSSSTSVMPADAGVVDCMTAAAGTVCGAGRICNGSMCITACFIDGMVQMPGLNPANVCERCVPLSSTTMWSPEPDTATCDDGDLCTNPDRCDGMGGCTGAPRCPATTPMCTPVPFACACTASPTDSCATGTNNKRCLGTVCGCMDNSDCGSGFFCGSNQRCTACNTPTACGSGCGDCRSLPMTLDEGDYYMCAGNTLALDVSCQPTACSTSRANCNMDDADACEANISSSTTHCAQCNSPCATGRNCVTGQCECGSNADCPLGQTCHAGTGKCRCNANNPSTCAMGYVCTNNRCVRQ